MNIPLTFASGLYDRMQPLYTGEVRPEGIDLNFLAIEAPRVIFDNMARNQAYDLAEMSSSEFITRLSAGVSPFVALPVFPSPKLHSYVYPLLLLALKRNFPPVLVNPISPLRSHGFPQLIFTSLQNIAVHTLPVESFHVAVTQTL
jgi:hypothetical protein